jgi:hypothetical protein
MARPRLFLACLAIVVAMMASSVSAAACPADQQFSGTLMPGATATIPVTTAVKANTNFIFNPNFCGGAGLQTTTMAIRGSSMTGDCALGLTFLQASAGTFYVTLRGHYLGVDGLAALPYTLVVHQSHCVSS